MSATMYALPSHDYLLTDEWTDQLWLHDLPKDVEELHTQALVASGDYFEMLASALEQIAGALSANSIEQYQLQHYINQLLYLQRHYRISKK